MTSLPDHPIPPPIPLFTVLSGPSGVGKDALLERLRERGNTLHRVVTATTRSPRPDERDGVHYRFVSPERFQSMIDADELLEWAHVYGNSYGVPRDPVLRALAEGKDVIVRTDVQGAVTIRRKVPGALLVFLAPPSLKELGRRLRRRGTDAPEQVEGRLREAAQEMSDLSAFDYLFVNEEGGLDAATETLEAILIAERHRTPPPARGPLGAVAKLRFATAEPRSTQGNVLQRFSRLLRQPASGALLEKSEERSERWSCHRRGSRSRSSTA